MESWNLNEIDVQPHQPQVLDSESEGRAILIQLPAGEQLQEHQVHERATLLVVAGEIEVTAGGNSVSGGVGLLAIFDPKERHEVTAKSDARLLLVLSPWPGVGHPSNNV
jgi:quercetin dioxygenase-like cupin family protein